MTDVSRRKMEVHVDTRGDWCPVERSGLEVPPAKSGLDLFVDPVADGLRDFGFNDVALRVYRHDDDDIANQVPGKFGAIDRRVGMHRGISDVDFMAGDRSVNHRAQRRPRLRIAVASLRVCNERLRCWRRLWRI